MLYTISVIQYTTVYLYSIAVAFRLNWSGWNSTKVSYDPVQGNEIYNKMDKGIKYCRTRLSTNYVF